MAQNGRNAAKSRATRKIIIFVIELIIIAAMIAILWFVLKGTEASDNTVSQNAGPQYTVVDAEPEEIGISEVVQQATAEGGTMQGYLNIALFGLDALSNDPNDLLKNYRSDSIMIASINQETGDIRICSVYRDTYMNLGNDTYNKCNGAYAKGGATQAISMLNSNLDMDITNWVSVSYQGLSETIDGLGGVYIDIDSEELKHINNYQIGIAEILKCEYTPIKETGYQLVNGLQASAYCRIRYTSGDDFKRTERQREVLKSMMDQAKKADISTLTKVFNTAISDVYTSLDSETMLGMVKNITKYNIIDEGGFPTEEYRKTGTIGAKGSCVVPMNLEKNVIWLHQFLFEDSDYEPSSTVRENSAKIASDVSAYVGS